MKKENCLFSGLPIHPGHGRKYVPTLVQSTRPVLTFVTPKCAKLYLKKKNPRVVRWTVTYRKLNKKMLNADQIRKRHRKSKKNVRPIVGADLEHIRQKKAQKDTIRQACREAAIKELQERKVKRQEAAKKVKDQQGKTGKPQKQQMPKKSMGPSKGR